MSLLYALICAGITLRLATFNRRGGPHNAWLALLAYLLAVAAAWSSLLTLLGLLPAPHLAQLIVAGGLLLALLKTRGSVRYLLPHRRQPTPNARNVNRRYLP